MLGYLIGHAVVHKAGFFIAFGNAAFNLKGIVGAKVGHQASLTARAPRG